jgi:hypothetical protein
MKPALITEEERRLISRHTKAALAVRKAHADCAQTVGSATLDAINAR